MKRRYAGDHPVIIAGSVVAGMFLLGGLLIWSASVRMEKEIPFKQEPVSTKAIPKGMSCIPLSSEGLRSVTKT